MLCLLTGIKYRDSVLCMYRPSLDRNGNFKETKENVSFMRDLDTDCHNMIETIISALSRKLYHMRIKKINNLC